jgi:hypothetical protein
MGVGVEAMEVRVARTARTLIRCLRVPTKAKAVRHEEPASRPAAASPLLTYQLRPPRRRAVAAAGCYKRSARLLSPLALALALALVRARLACCLLALCLASGFSHI